LGRNGPGHVTSMRPNMTDAATVKMLPRSRKADDRWMRSILRGQKFEGRGFSKRTVASCARHQRARAAVVHGRDRVTEHSRHWCDFTRGDFALSQATSLGSVTNPRALCGRSQGIEGRPVGGLAMPLRLVPLALLLGTSSAGLELRNVVVRSAKFSRQEPEPSFRPRIVCRNKKRQFP
jgi:hypothetical protein